MDGIVTCHGTIGLEAISQGIPVLTPYKGWYGHLGFTISANTKKEYHQLLRTNWWENKPSKKMKSISKQINGLYFCIPSWSEKYILPDDSEQNAIYSYIDNFLSKNTNCLNLEVQTIKKWIASQDAYYHVFKMKNAENYSCCIRHKK